MIELANGCICCTVADDFLPAMRTILARDPAARPHRDRDLGPGAAQAAGAPPSTGPRCATGSPSTGCWWWPTPRPCWPAASPPTPTPCRRRARPTRRSTTRRPLEELFEEQLGCGDLVLVNKADQIGAGDRAAVEALIRAELRPGVRLVWTSHGAVDPAVALGLGVGGRGRPRQPAVAP